MPIYSYQCEACDHIFDLRQSFDSKPEHECPECKAIAKRTFHPAAVIYKGSGFYTTDYRKPSPGSSEGSSSEGSSSGSSSSGGSSSE